MIDKLKKELDTAFFEKEISKKEIGLILKNKGWRKVVLNWYVNGDYKMCIIMRCINKIKYKPHMSLPPLPLFKAIKVEIYPLD